MEKEFVNEYVCQFHYEFSMDNNYDSDGVWVTKKTVSSKKEALAWVKENSQEERRFYEVRLTDLNVMKKQLECIKKNKQFEIPKSILISTYENIIKRLENDWRFLTYDKNRTPINLPERDKPVLLLIKKRYGRFLYKALIFNDWTKEVFEKNKIYAWKYIQHPSLISNEDSTKAYPFYVDLGMYEPLCELDLSDLSDDSE